MNNNKNCQQCHGPLQDDDVLCSRCGAGVIRTFKSPKSAVTALLLCLFLGFLGAHRFYVGRTKSALIMLVTAGGLGFWTLFDLITLACCRFKDDEGRTLIFGQVSDSYFKKVVLALMSLLGGIIVYAALIVGLVFIFTTSFTSVIQSQLKAIREGDLAVAYSYMADEKTSGVSFDDFKNYINSHPAILNNVSASFPEREMQDDSAHAAGSMKTKDGKKYEVEYMLIKEDKQWKIIGLRIGTLQTAVNNDATPTAYTNAAAGYSLMAPANWNHEDNDDSVLFTGPEGTDSFSTAITIQAMNANVPEGKQAEAVKSVIDDLKNQIKTQASNPVFLESGSFKLPSDASIQGEYFIATYTYKGHEMKKLQYIFVNKTGKTIYAWGYTTLATQYEKDLPVANMIFNSLKIK